jgi:isoleucyl-tRNA synthetase
MFFFHHNNKELNMCFPNKCIPGYSFCNSTCIRIPCFNNPKKIFCIRVLTACLIGLFQESLWYEKRNPHYLGLYISNIFLIFAAKFEGMERFREHKNYNSSQTEKEILDFWKKDQIFEKSLSGRKDRPKFIFYEGPPSANGMPGIHHVISRTSKDIFCRYKTLKNYLVDRKAGWDTHGLPVEISVEKSLGITKEDIGKSISIEEYNTACRKDVLKYKDHWDQLTEILGFWLDLDNPYITFENKYIESVWWLLKQLYDNKLLYKGYTIQPYSPAAGTGLSTHELNQPGCYKMVKDTSVVAQFKVIKDKHSEKLFQITDKEVFFLAWTTTPWTLPSNTALAVGENMDYCLVESYNPYTHKEICVILCKDLIDKYFPKENAALVWKDYQPGDKKIPFRIVQEIKGSTLAEMRYEQLLPYAQPKTGRAFVVITGDFVSTDEGTGIVHIAPSFGADDMRMAKIHGLGSLTMVDKQGRFIDDMAEFAGRYVKNAYEKDEASESKNSVDIDIVIKLKKENKAFRSEKYEHSYPHCWRTDKPILYYPLESWFIKSTAMKERLIALNHEINWQPPSTGLGRFENWLENLVDWNLSRSRYWGTPLPIWITEDKSEIKCIGSVKELREEIEKSLEKGWMKENPLRNYTCDDNSEENYRSFDLHRPYVDDIVLVSESGKSMYREKDLIDVWFDSGAMPYAQHHYPFENQNMEEYFPADFISEGVDQTRGWFFTLHAISTMVFDSVAFKNVLSHGLVLDKNGNKMSKRLGNAVDPFITISTYGADATRWYMITHAQPWDNLKFDEDGIDEAKRKFFGTLYNTYSFFALYANIDQFSYAEKEIPVEERPELDRWILSELHSLIKDCDGFYASYEPTKAGRSIQGFVIDKLSNWYVRLSRRRFWKGDYSNDKIAAYQSLYECLMVVCKLLSPIAPFLSDQIYRDLNQATKKEAFESVHLSFFPEYNDLHMDKDLEEKMDIARKISSLILSLRKKENIRVRQPLSKILIPVHNEKYRAHLIAMEELIKSETNIKQIEYVSDNSEIVVKKIKANFKKLGPRYGKLMKSISEKLSQWTQAEIQELENEGTRRMDIDGKEVSIERDDVEIFYEDIPGWVVTGIGKITVALDINISEALEREGLAREIVNRIQNLRKQKGFDVTDHILFELEKDSKIECVLKEYKDYICGEILADEIKIHNALDLKESDHLDLDQIKTRIRIKKIM